MQVQKDEVKNRILEAATEEFLVAGYQQASIRRIASQAGVAPANIYAYFSGKDDLFENIVGPTVRQLDSLIHDLSRGEQISEMSIRQMNDTILDVFLANRTQFMILVNGSDGSKYQNIKANIIMQGSRRISAELMPNLPSRSQDPLLADMLATALIEGIMELFNKYGGDIERMKFLLSEFLKIIFSDIYRRR